MRDPDLTSSVDGSYRGKRLFDLTLVGLAAIPAGALGLVGGRNHLDWAERLAVDLDYVDAQSPREDCRMTLATLRAALAATAPSCPMIETATDTGSVPVSLRCTRVSAEPPYDAGVTGYDEFAYFRENADEAGLAWTTAPDVERIHHVAESGRRVSSLRWGTGRAGIVMLHGGGQNAHTWDTVALALDQPLLAVDLPGHGHSDWRDDHDYRPQATAPDVAHTLAAHAPDAHTVVAMSLGGLTALALQLHGHPAPERLVLIDITPGVNREKASGIEAFLRGPETFASFDEILERTVLFNPTRSESSLRRGILHNARERPDGRWEWRYDLPEEVPDDLAQFDPSHLWDAIRDHPAQLVLARGGTSPVVDDDDVAELIRLRPDARVEVFADAGHSIQGDMPVELADFLISLTGS